MVASADNAVDIRAKEHTLIALWRPYLNHPYISTQLKLQDAGFVPAHQQVRSRYAQGG